MLFGPRLTAVQKVVQVYKIVHIYFFVTLMRLYCHSTYIHLSLFTSRN